MHKKIIIATGNNGKLNEIREIFEGMELHLQTMREFWNPLPHIEENGTTFAENAQIKADWVFGKTGIWSLGDDSGLAVDALDGAPGIRSARFAGENADMDANKAKLLSDLADTAPAQRTARFICALALRIDATTLLTAEGACEGAIISTPRGEGGFGYDPLFIPEGFDRTFGELTSIEKHRISHRGRALRKIKELLHEYIS